LWKRNESKRKRNSGDVYVDSNGNVTSAKVMGNPCNCRRNCFQLLTQDHCQKIFPSFWERGNFDVQNAYLYGQIRCINANTATQNCSRQYTYIYYVKGANGKDIKICREAFLGVHGLQNNRGRLGNIQTAIARGEPLQLDGRGKHSGRPNKHSDEHKQRVKTHIESFP